MSEDFRFVTLHPEGSNIDLVKDEGQIPYTLASKHNVKASFVSCFIDESGPNCEQVIGLELVHIPFVLKNSCIAGLVYLLKNAKKIDWLNIYFAGRKALIWTKFYKLLNHKGKVYLKLDMDFRSCDLYDNNIAERKIFTKNTEVVDIVSVESEAVRERIQPYSNKNIILIGNGYASLDFKPDIEQQRENTFLTVGRLGTRQKATDNLLQAFAKTAHEHNWKLKLIGSVEAEFEPYITEFFDKHSDLKGRVEFAGVIKDREMLYQEYCKAKVFVLPSRWESFGLVCGEALSCGCQLIVTDSTPPAKEMTNSGKFGVIVKNDDVDSLANALLEATKKEYSVSKANATAKYANTQFSWNHICNRLYDCLIGNKKSI